MTSDLPENTENSQHSLIEANRDQAIRSTHGGAGAAGFISYEDRHQAGSFLSQAGEVAVVNPQEGGFGPFGVGVAWDNVAVENEANPLKKVIKKTFLKSGVDLDLGCLYELKNLAKGGMQAFGKQHGNFEAEPYIALSGDERRGDRTGLDEVIRINGKFWNEIDRILLYVYIYDGAENWALVRPQIQVHVPGEQPMIVTLNTNRSDLPVCAVAMLENVRGGIKMTACMEYFPGHVEMDRAFGFGLEWEDGSKDS